jgi:hypothetical protein
MSTAFEKQLRQLMPTVDKVADRISRLRHYLVASMGGTEGNQQERLVKAGEIITRWSCNGIPQAHFQNMQSGAFGMSFAQWWSGQVSAKRAKAAKSGQVSKRKRSKPTVDRTR